MLMSKLLLLVLTVSIGVSLMGCGVAVDRALDAVDDRQGVDCSKGQRGFIKWDEAPVITDGVLTLRGRFVGSTQLHDPRVEVKPLPSDAALWGEEEALYVFLPAFSLVRINSNGETERVATIWPPDMAAWFLGPLNGDNITTIFTEPDGYNIEDEQFYIRTNIPATIQEAKGQLMILVWPPIADMADLPDTIGIECL